MARMRDVPVVFRTMGFLPFVKKVYFEINDDNLFTWAASLAYSWLFALFPFFVFLLTLIPLLKPAWKQEAVDRINAAVNTLPRETRITLHTYLDPRLHELLYQPPPAITGILSIGLFATIWAASGGLNTTMGALNKCYDVEKPRPFYKQRPLAVGLTMVVATLILFVVILIPIGTVVTRQLTSGAETVLATISPGASTATTLPSTAQKFLNPIWIIAWQIFRYSIGVLLMLCVVAIVYHFGPNIRRRWRIITPGSVFTVAAWIALGLFFRLYVDKYGKYSQTYGAVGGVAVLLLLFYLDSLMLLIGAEINAEIDYAILRLKQPVPPAVANAEVGIQAATPAQPADMNSTA
ncbi:MAG TPA: YihY/virulence factor BrkB family protein [Tepidisphaeraceae bacterium]|jgi:membrane protein